MRRTLLGMNKQSLAVAVGLTYQHIQRYEKGTNRIGASRLYQFSQVLDVPVSFFFDDMPAEVTGRAPGLGEGTVEAFETEKFAKRETLELVRAYYRIPDPAVRKRVFELLETLTGAEASSKSR